MAQLIEGISYLDGDEAAALLGVKKATLYAYVSRGVLRSYRQGIGRRRLYRCDDIEKLRAIRPSRQVVRLASELKRRQASIPKAESWAGEH